MSKDKWQTLSHNGPVFPPEYECKKFNIPLKIDGKWEDGNAFPQVEEMLFAWAQKHNTEYVKDKVFQKNFHKSLVENSKYFSDGFSWHLPKIKFPEDIDFSEMIDYIEKQKEEKKNRTKEEKQKEKEEKEVIKKKYGFAILNEKEVDLGNYIVEPPGIFMGRGDHPLRGGWKPRINPEDITINTSDLNNPPSPPKDHKWKKVVTNKNALWASQWIESYTGAYKRIMFSANSFIKQDSDKKKFSKAIKLVNNFDKINAFIDKKIVSRDSLTREIATVCKLISILCIRVGDEKTWTGADTVGAVTLRVEHVKIDDSTIILDFLGKDSIRYFNKVELDINTIRNIKEFMEGKKKGEMIFPRVNSGEVKNFLSIVMPGLTAKQFRTATGSNLLAKELRKRKIDKNEKVNKKLEVFMEANLKVAMKLNHQSAVPKSFDESLQNLKDKLKIYKKQLKEAVEVKNEEIERAKEKRDNRISGAGKRKSGNELNEISKKARETFKKKKLSLETKVEKLKEKIDSLNTKIRIKKQTKGIALGTSRLNYSDPRIPISWCKDNDVELNKIYPVTVQKKFEWAMDVSNDFYKKYPEV